MSAGAATLARPADAILLRAVERTDNPAVATIIRSVLIEFGGTGPGFAIHDPEVDAIFEAYQKSGCSYFVLEEEGEVVGCGGIAPLKGEDGSVCELQKFYLVPKMRGRGCGQQVLNACISAARAHGFKQCYLETIERMEAAGKLYMKNGFISLPGPMGNTGHHACTRWYVKTL